MLSTTEPCRLVERIQQLPQALRIQWHRLLTEASKEGRLRRVNDSWPLHYTPEYLREVRPFSTLVHLLLAQRTNADALGVPSDEPSKYLDDFGLEVCDFEFVSAANTFKQFNEARRGAQVISGESVQRALKRLFTAHAELFKEVVIVDRYALARFAAGASAGLENFLAFLGGVPLSRSIILYCARQHGTLEDDLRNLRKSAQKHFVNYQSSLAVRLVDERAFTSHIHCRYIRFGQEACWVDEGLQAFEGNSANRGCLCSFRKYDKTIRDIEATLRASSEERMILKSRLSVRSTTPG